MDLDELLNGAAGESPGLTESESDDLPDDEGFGRFEAQKRPKTKKRAERPTDMNEVKNLLSQLVRKLEPNPPAKKAKKCNYL